MNQGNSGGYQGGRNQNQEPENKEYQEKVVAINLMGVVAVTHAFLAAMIDAGRGGRIVNVASDAGRVGSSGEAVYAGAKGGVIATDTPLLRAQPERLQEALAKAVPMGRVGTPEEVAHAISFFASPEAGYVTGQVLSVSGGLTMAG